MGNTIAYRNAGPALGRWGGVRYGVRFASRNAELVATDYKSVAAEEREQEDFLVFGGCGDDIVIVERKVSATN